MDVSESVEFDESEQFFSENTYAGRDGVIFLIDCSEQAQDSLQCIKEGFELVEKMMMNSIIATSKTMVSRNHSFLIIHIYFDSPLLSHHLIHSHSPLSSYFSLPLSYSSFILLSLSYTPSLSSSSPFSTVILFHSHGYSFISFLCISLPLSFCD